EHSSPALLFWTVMVAVVAAPWVEEFLLRVVFQGWLERCFFPRQALLQPVESDPVDAVLVPAQTDEAPIAGSLDSSNPYATPLPDYGTFQHPPSGFAGPREPDPEEPHEQIVPPGWRAAPPIIISSIVFAGLHIGHGIDPIPLFFLALVLGWLYQRTHRLWPCVVLHTALNATSVALLFSSL
ncbi:MAG: CPBP family intramembrane metalloprotease, partial [Planctomycetes bacterium]|nr:CPBP family intramembrane metalloprotease [Planctomycetota bacterium]